MSNFEITKGDAEIIQDILEWANTTTFGSLTPTGYNTERSKNYSNDEFIHFINMVSHVSPRLFSRVNTSRAIYNKTDFLAKYMDNGGFMAEFNKLYEKQHKEEQYKQLEIRSLETTIETSKEAIKLAKDSNILSAQSNEIAKASNRKANLSNWIAGVAALLALLAFIFSLKK